MEDLTFQKLRPLGPTLSTQLEAVTVGEVERVYGPRGYFWKVRQAVSVPRRSLGLGPPTCNPRDPPEVSWVDYMSRVPGH